MPDPRWPTAVHELILDASELLPFDFLRTGDRLGRAVVKIQCEDGAVGTGFLVAPGILLTNNHVLPDVRTATGSYALANYESYPTSDALGRPAVAPLDPTVLFISNPDLDFTFCGVQGLDFLGTIPIDRNSSHISLLEYVNIIQHPRGRPKEVALQDNRVVKADNVVLHYACDTEPGSSGSPVFNNRWRLVALHHASVITDSPEGRFAANADPSSRYLNEGIRLSAIATWLETAEANTIERREQAKRLRSVFSGLDPQIGFFGALGRKACGKTAAEIVTDSYQGDADDVDIAFWSLGRLGRRFAEHLADVGRVVAELRLDLWCLTHAHPASVRALCEHLETNYQLAYEFLIDSADTQPYSAVIFKHSRTLAVEQIAWQANEHMSTARVPMHVLVRATTRSGDIVEFHLVPIPDEIPPEQGDNSTESTRLLVEAVGREIPKSRSTADWILIGDTGALLALQDVSALIQTGYELVTAAAERDGALAFLAGPASCVDQIFISPNLNPAIGRPECLVVTRDRTLPQSITSLTHPHPIAFRLALNGAAQKEQAAGAPRAVPAPLTHPPGGRDPQRQPEPTGLVTDADFEQRLRDMLMPMIAKIVAETRQQASGGKLS
ncbi:MAG TPA: serine protease [Isosphaeraceae bacterium]|nr:serine protease [Isosphaeraceae bacterium]